MFYLRILFACLFLTLGWVIPVQAEVTQQDADDAQWRMSSESATAFDYWEDAVDYDASNVSYHNQIMLRYQEVMNDMTPGQQTAFFNTLADAAACRTDALDEMDSGDNNWDDAEVLRSQGDTAYDNYDWATAKTKYDDAYPLYNSAQVSYNHAYNYFMEEEGYLMMAAAMVGM